MKKLVVVTLLSLSALYATAQDFTAAVSMGVTIPSPVLQSFTSLYPDIKDVNWDYNEPNYQASFKLRNKRMFLMFDEGGSVNEVKNEIMLVELPTYVGTLIARDYQGWHITKAMHIDVDGTDYYETAIEKEKESMTLVFDHTGGLMITVMQ